ncbi:oligosaccharide flippase family protein [bacterium]|nr:oligosaccharide flippase family protein [bacterium]
MTSSGREMARGTGLMFLGAIGYQVFEYLYRVLLARGLGMEGFGTLNQARAVFLLVSGLATLGLAQGIRQFVASSRTEGTPGSARRAILDGARLAAVAGIAGAALLHALADPVARLLHNDALAEPIRVLAFAILPTTGLLFTIHVGQAVRSYRPAAVAHQLLDPFLRFAFSFLLLLSGAGLAGILGGYVAATTVALVVAIVMVSRLHPIRELPRGEAPSRAGALLRYSLPLALSYVVHGLAERIDILMIGYFLDEARVGLYASGSAVARTLLILLASMMPVTATLAAEYAGRGDRAGIADLRRRAGRWMLLLGAPIAVAFGLFPAFLVTTLFGDEYAGGAPILRILAPGYLAAIVLGPLGVIIAALGKTTWSLQNALVRTSVNIALNALLIPRWGLAGAAVATTAAMTAGTAMYVLQLRKLVSFGSPFGGAGRAVAALAVAAAAGGGLTRWTAAPDGVGFAAFTIVYAVGVRAIPGCLQADDVALLTGALRRLRRMGSRSGDGKGTGA